MEDIYIEASKHINLTILDDFNEGKLEEINSLFGEEIVAIRPKIDVREKKDSDIHLQDELEMFDNTTMGENVEENSALNSDQNPSFIEDEPKVVNPTEKGDEDMNKDIEFFEQTRKQQEEREKHAAFFEDKEFFEKAVPEEKKEAFFSEKPEKKDYSAERDFFRRAMTERDSANYEKDREFFEKVMAGEQPKEKEPDTDPDFFRTLAMTRDEVIVEVKKDGMFLGKVADRYGNDPEIVALAVDNNANAYAFVSKKLQENGELAQVLIENKHLDLKEAESKKDEKGNVDVTLITTLQEQIETINAIHKKADLEKQRSQYHGPELTM